MTIKRVKIRAKIKLGYITIETPFILSFNVRKSRSQSSTFDTSLKISANDVSGNITGENIIISAGEDSPSNTIFTGIVKKATMSPCFDDPSYVILNISGDDALSLLSGKKYTRRCKGSKSAWVTIDSVVRPGLKSGKFDYINEPVIETEAGGEMDKGNIITTRDLVNVESGVSAGVNNNVIFEATPIITETD